MNLDTVSATPKSTVFGAKSVSWIRKVEEKSEALVVIEPMTFCSPRSRSNHRLLGHMWRATILHRTRWNNCNYHRKYISWFPCVETQTRLQKCPPPLLYLMLFGRTDDSSDLFGDKGTLTRGRGKIRKCSCDFCGQSCHSFSTVLSKIEGHIS